MDGEWLEIEEEKGFRGRWGERWSIQGCPRNMGTRRRRWGLGDRWGPGWGDGGPGVAASGSIKYQINRINLKVSQPILILIKWERPMFKMCQTKFDQFDNINLELQRLSF